jgi:chorismate mutase / prephenate dehydratase
MKRNRKIAYLGPPGTFTHEATHRFFGQNGEFLFRSTVREILQLYRKRQADYCVLAVESSIAGVVSENLDEIKNVTPLLIVGEVLIQVHHQLIAKPGANLDRIKRVIGHPIAIEESKLWLHQWLPEVRLERVSSSALAAKVVSEKGSLEEAAIATNSAAEFYGMTTLASNIEDSHDNVTRFWVLGKEGPPPTGKDKTTLSVEDDLDSVLRGLAAVNIPILSIYERPTGRGIGSHVYWIDVDGHEENPPLKYFFRQHVRAKYLGSYPKKY